MKREGGEEQNIATEQAPPAAEAAYMPYEQQISPKEEDEQMPPKEEDEQMPAHEEEEHAPPKKEDEQMPSEDAMRLLLKAERELAPPKEELAPPACEQDVLAEPEQAPPEEDEATQRNEDPNGVEREGADPPPEQGNTGQRQQHGAEGGVRVGEGGIPIEEKGKHAKHRHGMPPGVPGNDGAAGEGNGQDVGGAYEAEDNEIQEAAESEAEEEDDVQSVPSRDVEELLDNALEAEGADSEPPIVSRKEQFELKPKRKPGGKGANTRKGKGRGKGGKGRGKGRGKGKGRGGGEGKGKKAHGNEPQDPQKGSEQPSKKQKTIASAPIEIEESDNELPPAKKGTVKREGPEAKATPTATPAPVRKGKTPAKAAKAKASSKAKAHRKSKAAAAATPKHEDKSNEKDEERIRWAPLSKEGVIAFEGRWLPAQESPHRKRPAGDGAADGEEPAAKVPRDDGDESVVKSFARRFCPKTSPARERWIAVRGAFLEEVKPALLWYSFSPYHWEARS